MSNEAYWAMLCHSFAEGEQKGEGHDLSFKKINRQGRIQDFHLGGGGGRKILYARTHITSAKSEVPFGRDPGPLSGPWKL